MVDSLFDFVNVLDFFVGSNEFLFVKQGNLVQFSFQLVQSSDSGHLLSHKRLRGSLNVASVEIHVRDCGSFLFSNWLFRDSKSL